MKTRLLALASMLLLCSAVGQAALSCDVDEYNNCVCIGKDFVIDLNAAFYNHSRHNITVMGAGSYVLSPCVNHRCGGRPSRVCGWDATANKGTGEFNVIGTDQEVIWNVESLTKFSVTFGKGEAIYNGHIRAAQIMFIAGSKLGYSYDGQGDPEKDNPLVYRFTVTAPSFVVNNNTDKWSKPAGQF